jgi:hypothetical protein
MGNPVLSGIRKSTLLINPHIWIIVFLTLFLIFLYRAWPWREFNFHSNGLHWWPLFSPLENLALFEIRYHLIGSLFFLPIIYATITYFLSKGGLLITLIPLVGLWPVLNLWKVDFSAFLTNIVILMLPILIVVAIKIELELRRKDRKIFIEKEKDRQMYLTKILETQENERRRRPAPYMCQFKAQHPGPYGIDLGLEVVSKRYHQRKPYSRRFNN